jgi:hypothetical protein
MRRKIKGSLKEPKIESERLKYGDRIFFRIGEIAISPILKRRIFFKLTINRDAKLSFPNQYCHSGPLSFHTAIHQKYCFHLLMYANKESATKNIEQIPFLHVKWT